MDFLFYVPYALFVLGFLTVFIFSIVSTVKRRANFDKDKSSKTITFGGININDIIKNVNGKIKDNSVEDKACYCEYCGSKINKDENECKNCGAHK